MRHRLDTYVVSELVAKVPSQRVVEWVDSLDHADTFLRVVTVGELQRGIQRLSESRRRKRMESWLVDELLVRFDNQILPVDAEVMLEWGRLVARLERAGRTLPAWDSVIAAQALHFRTALATRNERDFEDCGIVIVNPWST